MPAPFPIFGCASIGPALMSGRISHIAVHPEHKQTWYIGVASGGVWKTTNAGNHVHANLPERRVVFHRRRRHRPEESEHDLGRHRRSQQPAQRRLRRRRLSQRRCRTHVAQRRAERLPADWPHRHRSAQLERRVRRGLRAAVEQRRRPRPLQDRGRRRQVDRGPRHQREHRYQRRGHRSVQSRRHARRRASTAAPHLDADSWRPGERAAQVDRRRQDVASRAHRASGRRCRPHRDCVLTCEEGTGVREGRIDAAGGTLRVARRRR